MSTESIIKPEVAALLKKWKVELRSEPQTVHHQTYGTDTILSPEQFACYEAALKSVYVQAFIAMVASGNFRSAAGCVAYHNDIASRNDIELPWIAQKYFKGPMGAQVSDLGEQYALEVVKDYRFLVAILSAQKGKNAKTGEEVNLYHATLD